MEVVRASAKLRDSRVSPTPRALAVFGAGLVLAALPVLVSGVLWPLWLAFCALFVVACGIDAAWCPRAQDVRLESTWPRRLPMAAASEGTLRLALPVPWPVAAAVSVDVSGTLGEVDVPGIEIGREPADHAVPLVPLRRGPATVDGLWLRYDAPLGLLRRVVRWRLGVRLSAVPNLGIVRGAAIEFWGTRNALPGQKLERFSGDGTEFHALREFVPGLDPRSVDWKASARHQRLLARELRAERHHQVVLALDTGRLMAEPVAGAPLVDHAIHAALALASVSLRCGDRVGFFSFDERPRQFTPPRGGPRVLPGLVELVGRLSYSLAETNFTLGLTHLLTRLDRRSLVVVLTDFVDSVTAELMVEEIVRLRRRHLVLFVALSDPLLGEEMDRPPRSLYELGLAVAADGLDRERQVVLGRLKKAGVMVIDTPPARLGPALLNRYLEIKRREMI